MGQHEFVDGVADTAGQPRLPHLPARLYRLQCAEPGRSCAPGPFVRQCRVAVRASGGIGASVLLAAGQFGFGDQADRAQSSEQCQLAGVVAVCVLLFFSA